MLQSTCFIKPKKCQFCFLLIGLKAQFYYYYIFNIVPYMSGLDSMLHIQPTTLIQYLAAIFLAAKNLFGFMVLQNQV